MNHYHTIIKEYIAQWKMLKSEGNYHQADQLKSRINKLKKRTKQCTSTGSL